MAKPFFFAGGWHDSETTRLVSSPYSGEPVDEIFVPNATQVRQALDAAANGLPALAALSSGERSALLRATSDAIAAEREDLARVLSLEAGKPIRQARAEVERAAETFRLGAQEVEQLGGEMMPLDFLSHNRGRFFVSAHFPLGVVCAITPFNFPLNLVAHKYAPALGAANSVVHKPASQTPLSALALARLIDSTGLAPSGALAVLPVGASAVAPLLHAPTVRAISFTGSPEVGWGLRHDSAGKRVLLELGGNAAAIVCADSDLEVAATRCASGGFAYAGQVCISLQRLLVERSVYPEFMQHLLAAIDKLSVGDPLDEATDVGPVINFSEADRVTSWIEQACQAGARLLCGGKRDQNLLSPTLLEDVPHSCSLWKDEVFGPVVVIEAFTDFDEALALANDERFGLQAGVFTRDIERLLLAWRKLDVGAVIHDNVPTFRADSMPYGGEKHSGLGREGLRYAIRELSVERTLVTAFP